MKIHIDSCPAHPLQPQFLRDNFMGGCHCRDSEATMIELSRELANLPIRGRTTRESEYGLQLVEAIMEKC